MHEEHFGANHGPPRILLNDCTHVITIYPLTTMRLDTHQQGNCCYDYYDSLAFRSIAEDMVNGHNYHKNVLPEIQIRIHIRLLHWLTRVRLVEQITAPIQAEQDHFNGINLQLNGELDLLQFDCEGHTRIVTIHEWENRMLLIEYLNTIPQRAEPLQCSLSAAASASAVGFLGADHML